jgi:hypothetical protein
MMQKMQNLKIDVVESSDNTITVTVSTKVEEKIKVYEYELVEYLNKQLGYKAKPGGAPAYRNYAQAVRTYTFELAKPKAVIKKKTVAKKKTVPKKETPKPTEG